eukprot:TRINITY_DN1859_c0_g1_i1.p1 TRINITY_DN1859_c0_g1~~TRINITY_DN1859_c0_g1_i1.p1  ORF type:complete len:104 (+),score=12.37 TRINITY_DN1859_c0_g1_i1:292-603(+)
MDAAVVISECFAFCFSNRLHIRRCLVSSSEILRFSLISFSFLISSSFLVASPVFNPCADFWWFFHSCFSLSLGCVYSTPNPESLKIFDPTNHLSFYYEQLLQS